MSIEFQGETFLTIPSAARATARRILLNAEVEPGEGPVVASLRIEGAWWDRSFGKRLPFGVHQRTWRMALRSALESEIRAQPADRLLEELFQTSKESP